MSSFIKLKREPVRLASSDNKERVGMNHESPYRIGEVGIKYCHSAAGRRESPISIEFLNCKVS